MSTAKVTPIGDVRRDKLIAALLTEPSIVEAAEAAGVAYSTARRWLQEPSFRAELKAASEEQRQAIAIGVTAGAAEAVQALRAALGDESGAIRVRAATALLTVHRVLAGDDLAERLDDLERHLS